MYFHDHIQTKISQLDEGFDSLHFRNIFDLFSVILE